MATKPARNPTGQPTMLRRAVRAALATTARTTRVTIGDPRSGSNLN
jgi:hypothetical protein